MDNREATMSILDFIDTLRNSDEYIRTIYTHGGCYQFYLLLYKMYGGAPMINLDKNHVATLYEGVLYDINGVVNDEIFVKPTLQDLEIAKQWSFNRNTWLTLGDCPACGEQLIVNEKGEIEC